MDPALAIVMAVFIGWVGIRVGKRNIENLIGTIPDPELVQRIEEVVCSIRGVREVHNIRLHFFGPYAEVDMHVVMDPSMTIEKSHVIADEIIRKTKGQITQIEFVTVHVEPR
jgi:cation diffusion facilitator family transporter